ncbi:unnamed protein product, partial [Ceratitis capitata]
IFNSSYKPNLQCNDVATCSKQASSKRQAKQTKCQQADTGCCSNTNTEHQPTPTQVLPTEAAARNQVALEAEQPNNQTKPNQINAAKTPTHQQAACSTRSVRFGMLNSNFMHHFRIQNA